MSVERFRYKIGDEINLNSPLFFTSSFYLIKANRKLFSAANLREAQWGEVMLKAITFFC